MIVLIVAAMAADLLTFALAVPAVGIGAEMNPVMARGYADIGLVSVILLKTACTVAICLLVLRVRRRRMRRLAITMALAIPLIGVAGNLTSWWMA